MGIKTRAQLAEMTKDELAEELLQYMDLSSQIKSISDKLDELTSKHSQVISELAVSKKCNSLLLERIQQLERESLDSSQYLRREMIELNPISTSIDDNELETKICKVLSMTAGTNITSSMLQRCHRLTKKNVVIVKFNDRKVRQNVITNRRKL